MPNKAYTKMKDLAIRGKALEGMKTSLPTNDFKLMEKRVELKVKYLEKELQK